MIRANADCSILMDVCPYCEKEEPCKECPLFQEYTKHKKLVEEYWEKELKRISEESEEPSEEYLRRLMEENQEEVDIPW